MGGRVESFSKSIFDLGCILYRAVHSSLTLLRENKGWPGATVLHYVPLLLLSFIQTVQICGNYHVISLRKYILKEYLCI